MCTAVACLLLAEVKALLLACSVRQQPVEKNGFRMLASSGPADQTSHMVLDLGLWKIPHLFHLRERQEKRRRGVRYLRPIYSVHTTYCTYILPLQQFFCCLCIVCAREKCATALYVPYRVWTNTLQWSDSWIHVVRGGLRGAAGAGRPSARCSHVHCLPHRRPQVI